MEQSNKIFDPHFFHNSNLPGHWATDQWVKISTSYLKFSQKSPQGIKPWGVNLLGVSYPGESLKTPGSQQPILKMFARQLKGQCHKINLDSYSTRATFCFFKSSRSKFFNSFLVSFFEPKILLTHRNLNQNKKNVNPLGSAQAGSNYEKKLEVENLVGLPL